MTDTRAGRPAFRPTHPGKIVRRNIDALGMTIEAFAEHVGTTRQTVSAIIAGRSAVTPDMSVRLARAFNSSAQFWLNMQANHDVWECEDTPAIRRIRPIKPSAGKARVAAPPYKLSGIALGMRYGTSKAVARTAAKSKRKTPRRIAKR